MTSHSEKPQTNKHVSKHDFKWGDHYHYATVFDYPVLDSMLDDLIATRGVNAQAAFDQLTEQSISVPRHTKAYWGSDYTFNGITYGFYIEAKE